MPQPPAGLEVAALLGRWHIVATTLGFWRGKHDARVVYEDLGAGRWRDTLHWKEKRRGVEVERSLAGIDRLDASRPGAFRWRGSGLLVWIASEWCFVAVAPDGRWAATWFSRATLGLTPEGMDVYAREPELPELDDVVAMLRARHDLPRDAAWYRVPR